MNRLFEAGLKTRLYFDCGNRLRRCVVDGVEQELERGVRLRPEVDLRPEDQHATSTQFPVNDGDTVFEILLTPGPPAAERRGTREPGDAINTARRRTQAEHRTVIEEDIYLAFEPVPERCGVVDAHAQHRAGDVVLLGASAAARRRFVTRRAHSKSADREPTQ